MGFDWTDALLAWYRQHARQLPWRITEDAYAIWVSEIMLQQTRVETVFIYFERWMQHFPDISTLAAASLQEVLTVWEGLGYYGRARNLHRASKIVVNEYGGRIPDDPAALRKLPGIGRYTAGAIASIAFGLDEPVLDGNVRRVLARVFNLTEPARSPGVESLLWELAAAHLPKGHASQYNQALMDLGSMICTPRRPCCSDCPVQEGCEARRLGVQEERPVNIPKPVIPHYTVTAAVISRDGQVLITQRPLNGLLGGLWEFPGGKLLPDEDLVTCLQREIFEELGVDIKVNTPMGVYRHAYTHFRVTLHAFCCSLAGEGQLRPIQVRDLHWATPFELHAYPMGKIDRQIAKQVAAQDKLPC
jgi:A/G-specific adenine glycosylase